jgi:hypothetical protein
MDPRLQIMWTHNWQPKEWYMMDILAMKIIPGHPLFLILTKSFTIESREKLFLPFVEGSSIRFNLRVTLE